MLRLHTTVLCSVLLARAALADEAHPIPSPAGPGSMGAALATGPDGAVHLSWLEPADGDGGEWALRFSRFDAAGRTWSAARTIARGRDWFANWADFPQIAVQEGRMTAVWFVENAPPAGHAGHHGAGYHARFATSTDGGGTWGTPQPVTRESTSVEFVALLPRPDGSLFAAWLDGRQRSAGRDVQALYGRSLSGPPESPDVLLDDSVCDCCQLSLVAPGAGEWLLAYRDRTADEIRDIVVARGSERGLSGPALATGDRWKIAGCPVNGPRLAAHGATVAAVWFTAAGDEARVWARVSRDGGRTFGDAVRVDLGNPAGRVDAIVRPDGRVIVSWLESSGRDRAGTGGIYVRALGADAPPGTARLVAPTGTTRAGGFPRIAAAGDGRLVVAFTREGSPAQVETLLVTFD